MKCDNCQKEIEEDNIKQCPVCMLILCNICAEEVKCPLDGSLVHDNMEEKNPIQDRPDRHCKEDERWEGLCSLNSSSNHMFSICTYGLELTRRLISEALIQNGFWTQENIKEYQKRLRTLLDTHASIVLDPLREVFEMAIRGERGEIERAFQRTFESSKAFKQMSQNIP